MYRSNVWKCTEKAIWKVIWVGKGALDAILSQINKKIGDRFHFQWHRRRLNYQFSNTSHTRSTGHASSRLSSGRIKDRTRETAETEPNPCSIQLKEYLVVYGSQPASKVGSHRLHYCEDIFFHLSKFMTKFTFEQCLLFWLLFKLARNRMESFPVRFTKFSSSFRSLK